ncbi:DUF2617 family protein [Cutibacterium acnes]|nr:DUF2617 family protein [Cutibacterium acnes]MCD1082968.1 DUF2617 family protein [Cutibacterium acnes]MCK6135230.1 DUF2617 family protein [Cutibacterium acnes]MCP9437776.1 DUF2617 family protein [Cutibacterium acnes]WGH41948.1 DUF2617 family protein [Cutibacterium acnes]
MHSKRLVVTGTAHQLTLTSVKSNFCHAIACFIGQSPQLPISTMGDC